MAATHSDLAHTWLYDYSHAVVTLASSPDPHLYPIRYALVRSTCLLRVRDASVETEKPAQTRVESLWPCNMRLPDVSSCAPTSTLLSAVPTQHYTNPFWGACAAPLYDASQCRSLHALPAITETSLPVSVASTSSVTRSTASLQSNSSARPFRHQELKCLPCPTLYQAKEPEAISDVLRRAGKKALGGGIPGE